MNLSFCENWVFECNCELNRFQLTFFPESAVVLMSILRPIFLIQWEELLVSDFLALVESVELQQSLLSILGLGQY